jgi:hypothetical protein
VKSRKKVSEPTVDDIIDSRIIQMLGISRKIAGEHNTVPCVDGIVIPSQSGEPNYDDPEEMLNYIAQVLKQEKEQIARDRRIIDHLYIATKEILGKPSVEPEQKLNKAVNLFGKISADRFRFRSLNVHDLSMKRVVTPLMNSIVDTMTPNTKQMMDQARQDRLRSHGGALPPL